MEPRSDGARGRSRLRAIALGGASMLAGNLASAGLRYAASIIVGRMLGAGLFGDFGLVMSCERVTQVAGEAGLPQANLKYIAAAAARGDRGAVRQVSALTMALSAGASVVMFGVLWLTAPLIATHIYDRPDLIGSLRIASVMVPLLSLTTTALTVPQAARRILPRVLIARMGVPVVFLGGTVVVGLAHGRVPELVWAYTIAAGLGMVAAVIYLGLWLRGHAEAPAEPVPRREVVWFASTLLLSAIGRFTLTMADVLILGAFVTPDELGVYIAASRTAGLILMPMGALGSLLSPVASELLTGGDIDILREAYRTTTRWTTGAAFALVAPMLIAPTHVMELFGRDFSDGGLLLVVVGVGQLINESTGSVGPVLVMTGGQQCQAAADWSIAVALTAALLLVAPVWGTSGGAICVAASWAVLNLLRAYLVWRTTGIHSLDGRYIVCWLASGLVLFAAAVVAGGGGKPRAFGTVVAYYAVFAASARWGWFGPSGLAALKRRRGQAAGSDE